MKKVILVVFCFLAARSFGQTAPGITVKGLVTDSVTNKPMSFVTAALQDVATKLAVKTNLTKDDGSFELKAPADKAYQLVLVFIGYKNRVINIDGKTAVVDLGKVLLSPSINQLKEVSVTAVKPLMKQEVDRISYDVQADPEAKSVTALDMMRKVPLLSVDATDNIKLRGSGNYKILINGKESAMLAKNPSDVLKSMPGTNILKIEVITTPPAKYDAEGLAGIINIITAKNADQGYNGSANANYNSIYGYRLNLNATVKQGKFGFTGYIGTGKRPTRGADFENGSTFYNPVPSSLLQNGTRFNGGRNTYASTEMSYELDTLNLFSGTINIYNNNNTQGNNQFLVQRNSTGAVSQSYYTTNDGNNQNHGSDFALNYQLGFKHHKDELLTVSYKYGNWDSKQANDVLADQRLNYNAANYRQFNTSGAKEHTTQLDYILPLKKLTIEAGGKMIARNSYSYFRSDTAVTPTTYQTNNPATNDFNYSQDVYGLYNSYQLKLTKWAMKGGLRLERTTISADFTRTAGGNFSRGYNNLVPSVSLQRTLKNASLTLGFTQRIQRPGIYQLNPFSDNSNPKYITRGNPDLRPAVNNNIELSYGNFAKGSINISTNYSFANNAIENVVIVDANAVTTTTFANVGSHKNWGLDVNINYPITKKLNVNINGELMQVWLKGTYNGTFYTNKGKQGHMFTYTGYKFDDGYRLGLNIGYDSRYVLLQGVDNWYFFSGISGAKDLFKNKATISVNVNNPFSKFNKLDFFTKTVDFQTYNSNMNYYRAVNLNFTYKFGKLNANIKKNQRGINNDDAAGGRGN